MEIILTKECEGLTGMLDRDYGYYIRRAPHKDGKVRFFGQRSKWSQVVGAPRRTPPLHPQVRRTRTNENAHRRHPSARV